MKVGVKGFLVFLLFSCAVADSGPSIEDAVQNHENIAVVLIEDAINDDGVLIEGAEDQKQDNVSINIRTLIEDALSKDHKPENDGRKTEIGQSENDGTNNKIVQNAIQEEQMGEVEENKKKSGLSLKFNADGYIGDSPYHRNPYGNYHSKGYSPYDNRYKNGRPMNHPYPSGQMMNHHAPYENVEMGYSEYKNVQKMHNPPYRGGNTVYFPY